MEEFINLHNRTVSRSEVERVISIAKEQNNTEVIYRLSRILNAYPTEQRFVINIKDYPTPPTALAGAHHTGDYREALDDCGRLKKGWKFSKGQVVKVVPKAKKTPNTPTANTAVVSNQLVSYTAEKFANDLDINKLERSLHWLSFDPKGRAQREQESFGNSIAELYTSNLEQAKQTGALEAYNDVFDKGYSYILKNYLEMVGIRARTFSTAITGGAGITERKIASNEKLMRSEHERLQKHIDLQEKLQERLAKIAKNTPADQYEEGDVIKSTDNNAITKLQQKLKMLQDRKTMLKNGVIAAKEYQKSKDISVFKQYNIDGETTEQIINHIDKGGKPTEKDMYSWFTMPYLNRDIKEVENRIATLEKNQAKGTDETLIEGGKIVYNGEAQRLQIFFDGIPSKEVREALKSHAFKWAPTAKAWQRTLTENAKYAVNQYLIKTGILKLRTALSMPYKDDELTFLAAAGIDYFEEAPDDKAQGLGKPIPAADIYKMITDKIIKMLKSTKASDYKKTWEDDAFFIPLNFDSKKPYRGVNRMLLQERIGLTEAFANPYFLTFKQIKKYKGTLKKGAKGYEVVYYSIRYVVPADKNSGRKAYSSTNAHKVIDFLDKHKLPENIVTRIPMIRYYNVYNGEDITGIDFKLPEVKIGRAVPDTAPENQAAAIIVENYPNPPAIKHGGNEAYYKLSEDLVRMPKIEQFDSVNDYYRTLFHELTHSTRHESRLNREKISFRFGDSGYAKEELVAEFGAVFLSAWAGIMWYNNKNHAAYLKGWNSAIKEAENDNKFLMKAASLAQAATDYILNLDAAGQPAFLSKYEKPNKAEKPKKKASASKIQIIPPYPIDIESNEENDDYMQLEKELSDLMGDKFEVWANNLIEQKRKARLAERSKEIKANIDTLKNKEKGATAYEYVRNEYGYNYKVDKKDTKKYEVTLTIYRYGSFNPNENYYDTFKTPEECSAFIIKTLDEQDGFYYSNWYGLSELQNKINELKGYQYSKQFHYQEEEKKAEKTKPEVSKPESSLYEAFSKLLSQIKSTNADIPSNELEDFLYNFGSQHYIEKEKIYTFFYDKVTKPIGSLSAYKKHPLFTKVKNPQPHHAGYTTTKRGTEILNIFIKDFEALKQQYDYNHYSFTKFWNIATEKPKKKATKATEKADNTDKKYKFIAFYNSYGRINGIYSYQNLTINEFYLKNAFDDGIKVYAPLRSLEKIEEAKRIIEEQYIEGKDFVCLKFESKKREEYYSLLIHSNEKPKPAAPKAPEKFPAAGTTKVFFTSQVDEIVDYVKKNGDNRGYINIDFTDKQTLKLLSQYGWGTYGFINTYDYPESAPKSKTKGVMSLKKIVSTDKLRIQITGVYIDSDYYIATNAISLIWVPRPKNDEYKTGWIFDANFKCKKLGGCKIEDYLINSDRFPIDRIREMQKAPIAYTSQQIDLTTLLDHLYRGYKAIRVINSTQEAIVITLQADKKIQYIDLKILIDLLDALRNNGAQTITFGFENLSGNSPIHISTDTQLQGLVMPRIFDENKVPTVKNCLMIAPLPLTLTEISKPTKGLSAPTDGTLFGTLPIFKTLKEAKKYFLSWALTHLRGKKVFHKELDKYVVFNRKGIEHTLSSKISFEKMKLILQAEEMLKNSHLITFAEDYKGREHIKGAYRMSTKATLEGEELKVILTLREGENGVIYYDHKIEEIEKSTTPPRRGRAKSFCGDSAPTNIPAKTVPNKLANPIMPPTVYVEHLPEETNRQISTAANQNTLDAKMAALQTRNWETFVIANPQLQRFLGDVERKTSESTVITIAGGAGSGKTRFAFQFINALAQNYKVGHASLEEHPDSKLYYDKVQQYIDETALPNIDVPEIKDLDQLEALIQRNEVIVIDSFAKLQELNPRFLLDRDLRKKYDGKLFLLIYQLTGEGKMRGGSKSEFDGDIILLTHVAPDYRENYIYPSKNRYNALPATQLRYSTYFQQMLDIPKELGTGSQPTEAISLPPAPQTNVYEVIY
ncbi:zincin-like metallopeptidase domain-containing protein [Capnocytophaga leadbetteri]|uniref:zincin-like metallopeptidase domain-containing protein n=2 Tax=Capnocytophaga TaxID=1016 RepID=UPI0026EF35BF|nr:zincin-like metallopeptidase domain-containing protein [Capnocytophaga leadbetteri]